MLFLAVAARTDSVMLCAMRAPTTICNTRSIQSYTRSCCAAQPPCIS